MTPQSGNLAIFDLDYTLTKQGTWGRFVVQMVRGRPHLWLPLLFSAGLTQLRYKLGLLPRVRVKQAMIRWSMIGKPKAEMLEQARKFGEAEVPDGLRPGALRALEQHKAAGDTIMIVSAAVDIIVADIAGRLDIKHYLATDMSWDENDSLRQEFATPNCYGSEKVRRLEAYFTENPELKQNHTLITMYSDSYSDVEILRFCEILSAGRGSRLLPLTENLPKCLLPIGLTTVLGMQLDTLFHGGVEKVTVVTGFNAEMVDAEIDPRQSGPRVKTLYNPFYQVADNLASCWMARKAMKSDFLLINGDTLFSPELLQKVLTAPAQPISVTIDKKDHYDGDDMKVTLEGSRLHAIGKTLTPQQTNGESIGMLRFMGDGPKIFKNEIKALMRNNQGTKSWFLSAIHGLAQNGIPIETINIQGSDWSELDTPEDYEICRSLFGNSDAARQRFSIL